jgi:hypothetical protein
MEIYLTGQAGFIRQTEGGLSAGSIRQTEGGLSAGSPSARKRQLGHGFTLVHTDLKKELDRLRRKKNYDFCLFHSSLLLPDCMLIML